MKYKYPAQEGAWHPADAAKRPDRPIVDSFGYASRPEGRSMQFVGAAVADEMSGTVDMLHSLGKFMGTSPVGAAVPMAWPSIARRKLAAYATGNPNAFDDMGDDMLSSIHDEINRWYDGSYSDYDRGRLAVDPAALDGDKMIAGIVGGAAIGGLANVGKHAAKKLGQLGIDSLADVAEYMAMRGTGHAREEGWRNVNRMSGSMYGAARPNPFYHNRPMPISGGLKKVFGLDDMQHETMPNAPGSYDVQYNAMTRGSMPDAPGSYDVQYSAPTRGSMPDAPRVGDYNAPPPQGKTPSTRASRDGVRANMYGPDYRSNAQVRRQADTRTIMAQVAPDQRNKVDALLRKLNVVPAHKPDAAYGTVIDTPHGIQSSAQLRAMGREYGVPVDRVREMLLRLNQ